ncbi:UNVERIFIED_CONTAM: hypothetical protein HDU68_005500 [Siphonaria sp. JEL0065]|nr:hypothetical protein HDU68_005500 [Siphonaria sp. JEL0065]
MAMLSVRRISQLSNRCNYSTVSPLLWKRSNSPYNVLGVNLTATPRDIKRRYYELSLLHHPDRLHQVASLQQKEARLQQFMAIQEAYELLKDPHSRKVFDTVGSMTESTGFDLRYGASDGKQQYREHCVFEMIVG